jgi:hypothetical protein
MAVMTIRNLDDEVLDKAREAFLDSGFTIPPTADEPRDPVSGSSSTPTSSPNG